jgi:transposase
MKQIETKHGEEIEEILRHLFVDCNYTQKEIAEELQLSYLTVIRWLRLSGVRSRRLKLGD